MTATGDVALDVVRRLVELAPAQLRITGQRNVWAGPELPPDGAVPVKAVFVDVVTWRHLIHNTGMLREIDVQVLYRFARGPDAKERGAARDAITAIYDAANLSGGWEGAVSRGVYTDLRALDGPVLLQDRYYSLNLTAWRDG